MDEEEHFALVMATCEWCPESDTCGTKADFLDGENNLDDCPIVAAAIQKGEVSV